MARLFFFRSRALCRPSRPPRRFSAAASLPPTPWPDESDQRHGAYDFYAEQIAAPDDLKQLTDQYESLPFRRRGYGECDIRAHFFLCWLRALMMHHARI